MGGEKGSESRGSMSLFGVLRLRLSQETAPNSAQDDEFKDENNADPLQSAVSAQRIGKAVERVARQDVDTLDTGNSAIVFGMCFLGSVHRHGDQSGLSTDGANPVN
jgi:hypothetical protein